MKIGIIGAGRIGHALGVRFAASGHGVMLSNSRGPQTLEDVVASFEGNALAGTVAEAARFGEVAAVAIPTQAIRDLPPEPFAGRLVIDANNYYPQPGRPVPELDADETTSSELLASLLPGGESREGLQHDLLRPPAARSPVTTPRRSGRSSA